MKKWTSLDVDNMMVVSFWMFVSVISKLIKPYHCCVYGSFCHICSCINANKDVWLVLSGMMAISSGKKCSQFCCAVVVQEQRLILCLSCFIVLNGGLFLCCGLCTKSCTPNDDPFLCLREKTKVLWWLDESLLLGTICILYGLLCRRYHERILH